MQERCAHPRIQRSSSIKYVIVRNRQKFLALFFTLDRSPDNRSVVDIQRRASWIALALVLQALNEINDNVYLSYVPFLLPWGHLIGFGLIIGSFFAMWMAFRPVDVNKQTRSLPKNPQRWHCILLILVLVSSLFGVIEMGRAIYGGFFTAPIYNNDGTSLDTNAAILLLEGHNPYADSSILTIARRFPIEPNWTTPLRQGQFSGRLDYPSINDLRSALDTDLKSGLAPEFESKVSYPSLSFLTLIPFVWIGIYNVLPLYLLCYIALVILGWMVARKEIRPWIILLGLANIPMWSSVVGGNLDIVAILFVVIAWLGRERRWVSALAIGVAIACKQPAWFFLPFYAVLIGRSYGWKEAVRRLLIAGGLFLVFNLPFMLWDFNAWMSGVMAPINDPMFPMGVGIIGLVGSPLVPSYLPPIIYSTLEYGIFYPLCLFWYWRLCRSRPEAVMLLAVIPLFFAWRSLSSYFYSAAFPMLLLLASRENIRWGSQPQDTPVPDGPVLPSVETTLVTAGEK